MYDELIVYEEHQIEFTVRKYLTIFCISFYLFSVTDMKEVFRSRELVMHFHEHQQADPSVSFCQFLVMHYLTDDKNDKDDSRERELPFKSPQTGITLSTLVLIACNITDLLPQTAVTRINDFPVANDTFLLTDFYSSIWHPPQLA